MSSQNVANVVGRLPVGGEFGQYHGDCVVYAFMIARAAINPQYSTTLAELNRLTTSAIAAGQAGSQGQMTDGNLVWLCQSENVAYSQSPYNQGVLDAALRAGIPAVCGFSNGQALPGNEPNVYGHAVAFLDVSADGHYTLANGDSVNGRAGHLDIGVPLSSVQAAHPTTITQIRGQAVLQIQDVSTWYVQVDASTWKCKQNGYIIKLGLLDDYRAFPTNGSLAGMTGLGIPLGNEHPTGQPDSAAQTFERGIRVYDPGRHVDNPPGSTGPCYSAHIPPEGAPVPPQPPVGHPVDTQGIIADANSIIASAQDVIKKASA